MQVMVYSGIKPLDGLFSVEWLKPTTESVQMISALLLHHMVLYVHTMYSV